MTKRLCLSIALAVVATLLIAVPVLAAYYAYIYVEESDGNSYESLPASVPCNTTTLIQGDFMASTALDTRVLTGSGEALPHMVANDKVMFVTDLGAYEKKTLIFYLGATSLSSFPIIVGYDGSFETPDDPDLELGYVMELLISGYFNAETADVGHNILYKEDAFRVWISAEDTLRVAALNSTGDVQWYLQYAAFGSGDHTVYIVANGLAAYLYVDDFVTAKDTENLYDVANAQLDNTYSQYLDSYMRHTFYSDGLYWAFYQKSGSAIYYKTSADGSSWSSEYTIGLVSGDSLYRDFGVWFRNDYMHVAYGGHCAGADGVRYRMGAPEGNSTITWNDDWQTAVTLDVTAVAMAAGVTVDSNDYPFVIYAYSIGASDYTYMAKSSSNNGIWAMAGDYPFQLGSTNPLAHCESLTAYPNSDKLYALRNCDDGSYDNNVYLYGRYYNGSSWSGSADTIEYGRYNGRGVIGGFNAIADADDNLYIVYGCQDGYIYLRIRYADGSFSTSIPIAVGSSPSITYNEDTGYIYISYLALGSVQCRVLVNNEISAEHTLFTPTAIGTLSACPYGGHVGIAYTSLGGALTGHGTISFLWEWNDNDYDWYWNQDNACPYIDDIQMAVDGVLQLEYKPDSIIQGTTLPDEENDHDAIINWGANPAGVDTSMSALQFEQSYNETYYYQYLSPGSTDIIKPEPGAMSGDVDLIALHNNPLYPLVQVLTIAGFLTERLAWLGLAWFIVIVAMFGVHLGFDTRKDTEKPQHFILTTITGLGLSILFYTMGIFPLWVVILMSFGLVGAIIWERQPVL
jgi:hypothetical protein